MNTANILGVAGVNNLALNKQAFRMSPSRALEPPAPLCGKCCLDPANTTHSFQRYLDRHKFGLKEEHSLLSAYSSSLEVRLAENADPEEIFNPSLQAKLAQKQIVHFSGMKQGHEDVDINCVLCQSLTS